MSFELKGKITEIGTTVAVTDKLNKRQLVVEYAENPQYPEFIAFEAIQDRTKLLDNLRVGDEVEVHFNVKGRPWVDKAGKKSYFNSLQLWKVAVVGGVKAPATTSSDDSELPF